LQMVTNKGQQGNLFRGAWMNSGSPIPVGPIDSAKSQAVFDFVSDTVGCRDENKTLACMRLVPYLALKAAIERTPGILTCTASPHLSYFDSCWPKYAAFFLDQSLSLSYLPQADGVFLTDNRELILSFWLEVKLTFVGSSRLAAQKLVAQGQYSKVPMVTGDMDDEGTLFSLTSANVTTEQQFKTYISENYSPRATQAEVSELAAFYPQDPTQGSPFDTGYLNQLTRTFALFIYTFLNAKWLFFYSFQHNSNVLRRSQETLYSKLPEECVFTLCSLDFSSLTTKRINSTSFPSLQRPSLPMSSFSNVESLSLSSEHSTVSILRISSIPTRIPILTALIIWLTLSVGYSLLMHSRILLMICPTLDHLNPNPRAATTNPNLIFWPKYTAASTKLLTFLDLPPPYLSLGSLLPLSINFDDYRINPMAFLTRLTLKYPL
jgi:hypothetical protein